MFDWIPIQDYTYYFNVLILILVLVVLWQCHTAAVMQREVAAINGGWGFILALLIILYMGSRPIDAQFGDTVNYANGFLKAQRAGETEWAGFTGEWAFFGIHAFIARVGNIHDLFMVCAAIYVGALWLAMRRIFSNYYYVPLLVAFSMFSFWSFGVNGIRNGLGASVFILALSYINRLPVAIALAFVAAGFHKSVYLMIGAAILAWFYKNSKHYTYAWLACIPISAVAGTMIMNSLGFIDSVVGDDRFSGYVVGDVEANVGREVMENRGFRLDFIAFSGLGVAIGYYFIVMRKFADEYYHWIYNTYLICNAFWILIIRVEFSNRFAQISWFLLPIVLIYPYFKERFFRNHEKILGYSIIVFYAYTFYENFIH